MAILVVSETYFPLRGPIPGNVTGSNPFPLQSGYISTAQTYTFKRGARWLSGRVSDSGARGRGFRLCPCARHFTPRKYWIITQEAMAPSRHDWKIVDWDVKPQHKQNKHLKKIKRLRHRKKYLKLLYYKKVTIFRRFRDIFPLSGPIAGNVTGSNPVPIAVWLHIYRIDINISRK